MIYCMVHWNLVRAQTAGDVDSSLSLSTVETKSTSAIIWLASFACSIVALEWKLGVRGSKLWRALEPHIVCRIQQKNKIHNSSALLLFDP